ncbi:hypothetical protein EW146_g3814 [Bondarzewia mesenterica]|uniref:Eisosome component PIL1-domain-containing protein n=1 Tax=Bondarzewia mesenterica TaxID=1095465 RepID=A0A4S4LWW7_9AGAM|nr:hypothetical protein EW146_g3814 [Bondarzewia mesenterica]
MFRTAATRIAHNTTLPALGGNKDIRPLQDLITAEKAIVHSLLKLSGDFSKASEALRNWGHGEGDDLGDTLSASTALLSHISSALSKLASHEQSIRDHMKSVRTAEENLEELKRRRRALASKADSAEKKLNKMSPEHKNMQAQSELLNGFRDEIRAIDSQIMSDEARLGDLKRSASKSWMTLKFGGLQEVCQKGLIIGETGKLIIAEIPQDPTQPGAPRPYYTGHQHTEQLVAEAQHSIAQVVFNGFPSSERLYGPEYAQPNPNRHDDSGFMGMPEPDSPHVDMHNLSTTELGVMPPHIDTTSHSQTFSPPFFPGPSDSVSSLPPGGGGGGIGPSGPRGSGGQFATFPVKVGVRPPNLLGSPLTEGGDREANQSFSSAVAEALGEHQEAADDPIQASSPDDPVPMYEPISHASPSVDYVPPPGPPPGAAPPFIAQSASYGAGGEYGISGAAGAELEDDGSQLPWMEPGKSERRLRFASRAVEITTPQRQTFASPTDEASQSFLPEPSLTEMRQSTSPPPPFGTAEDPQDEKALNAAAAREVSRELDSLTFNPPQRRSPSPPSLPLPAALSIPPAPAQKSDAPGYPRASESPTAPPSPYNRSRNRETSPTVRSPVEPFAPHRSASPTSLPSPKSPSSPTRSPLPCAT